jgi:tetratricopeptide (TPR) repeat protein
MENYSEQSFCSRSCAVAWASDANTILIADGGSTIIAPEQATFDRYAEENNLTHHLLAMEEGEAARIKELKYRIEKSTPALSRIARLALLAESWGYDSLAKTACNHIQENYEGTKVIMDGNASFLFMRLGRYDFIDRQYEKLLESVGVTGLGSPALSTWGFSLCFSPEHQDKALAVSSMAVEADPSDEITFANHIAVQRAAGEETEDIIEYANKYKDRYSLSRHISMYQVGRLLLEYGSHSEAVEHLSRADKMCPDLQTKRYLAEGLWKAGRLHKALELARKARRNAERRKNLNYNDVGSTPVDVVEDDRDVKSAYRKVLLALEGRILIDLGEVEVGRKVVRKAIDINQNIDDPILDDLPSLTPDYMSRDELARSLKSKKEDLANLTSKISSLRNALDQTKEDAEKSQEKIKELEDTVIASSQVAPPSFPELRSDSEKSVDDWHPNAHSSALNPLREAYYLKYVMDESGTATGDWAAPMVYYAKALERHLTASLSEIGLDPPEKGGLGSLIRVFNHNTGHIVENSDLSPDEVYGLIDAIEEIRKKYRNGFIHHDSMDRGMLNALFKFGRNENVFCKI